MLAPCRVVTQPGNVKLSPEILKNSQEYVKKQLETEEAKPVFFVFHGGSGSEQEKIREALTYGVIKMNIDTDTQWAYWDGVRQYEKKHHDYLQVRICSTRVRARTHVRVTIGTSMA